MKTRSMYKAEQMSLDRLPEPVLETILSLLPTEEAARTSILSRAWRYKWTKIPNLRFTLRNRTSELTYDIEREMKYVDTYDIYRVLLLRQGPINELTIFLDDYWEHYDCYELHLVILNLSRKHTVKKLTLYEVDDAENMWHKLPESVFSLHHLTDLCLCTFEIDHPSIFNGFGSLETLELSDVKISTQTLLHLLSNCPSLKKLDMYIDEPGDTCTINELLKCLPVIEDLTISGFVCPWLVLDSVPKERPISLIHLKSLCLSKMCLVDSYGSDLLLLLIKCSPNLERMHLEMEFDLDFSAINDKYSDVWLEHLNDLSICFGSSWLDTEFGKFILARSPKLKKVTILLTVDRKQESKLLRTLLRAPRASRGVKIITWRVGPGC